MEREHTERAGTQYFAALPVIDGIEEELLEVLGGCSRPDAAIALARVVGFIISTYAEQDRQAMLAEFYLCAMKHTQMPDVP